jgi:hypothetical protein
MMGDASRKILEVGEFDAETTQYSLVVLEQTC